MGRIILLTKERGAWLAWECAATGLDESVPAESVLQQVAASNPGARVVVASDNSAAARAQLEGLAEGDHKRLIRW